MTPIKALEKHIHLNCRNLGWELHIFILSCLQNKWLPGYTEVLRHYGTVKWSSILLASCVFTYYIVLKGSYLKHKNYFDHFLKVSSDEVFSLPVNCLSYKFIWQMKAFSDYKIKCFSKIIFGVEEGENFVGKRGKCGLPTFSPFQAKLRVLIVRLKRLRKEIEGFE